MGFGEGHGLGSGHVRGKQERVAVPAMPMPLAVICCILNFLLPGFGTIIAGFSTFCCARNEDMTILSRCGSCCISFAIGLLQLLTTALLLIGWIWSCVWGVFFLGMSSEYYHDNPPDGGRGAVINQQTTVVVQPGPTGYPQYPSAYGQPGYGQPGFQQPNMYQGYPPQSNIAPPQPNMAPPGGNVYPPQQMHGGYAPPQSNIVPPPGYSAPPSGPDMYEPPPPYTETPQQMPSAPPAEKS